MMSAVGARRPKPKSLKSSDALTPLTPEEVEFCWLSIAERGHLSVDRLKQFMRDVCGEDLSTVQAKDLLSYMDADGNNMVGKEDFRYFMSVGSLEDTDAKSFMWHPKSRYREEHGIASSSAPGPMPGERWMQRSDEASPEGERKAGVDLSDLCAANLFSSGADRPASSASDSGDSDLQSDPATGRSVMQSRKSMPHALPGRATIVHAAELSPLPSLSRSHPPTGRKSVVPTPRTPHTGRAEASRKSKYLAALPASAVGAPSSARVSSKERPRKPNPRRPQKVDERTLRHIDSALERYQRESWDKFLNIERDCRQSLFQRFASSDQDMAAHEYHRMLMKWHKNARWCMPADIRPGDSIATLEYVLRREREQPGVAEGGAAGSNSTSSPSGETSHRKTLPSPAGGPRKVADGTSSSTVAPDCTGDKCSSDAKLAYKVWLNVLNGKHRPDEQSAAHRAHSR